MAENACAQACQLYTVCQPYTNLQGAAPYKKMIITKHQHTLHQSRLRCRVLVVTNTASEAFEHKGQHPVAQHTACPPLPEMSKQGPRTSRSVTGGQHLVTQDTAQPPLPQAQCQSKGPEQCQGKGPEPADRLQGAAPGDTAHCAAASPRAVKASTCNTPHRCAVGVAPLAAVAVAPVQFRFLSAPLEVCRCNRRQGDGTPVWPTQPRKRGHVGKHTNRILNSAVAGKGHSHTCTTRWPPAPSGCNAAAELSASTWCSAITVVPCSGSWMTHRESEAPSAARLISVAALGCTLEPACIRPRKCVN